MAGPEGSGVWMFSIWAQFFRANRPPAASPG